MTLDEEMVGWSFDGVLNEWSFPFLRFRYKDGSRATSSAIVGVDGLRMEDGHERGKDYASCAVIPGRYEHAMRCFMKAERPAAQRLWNSAIEVMRLYVELSSAEDEQKVLARRWELGMLEIENFVEECQLLREYFGDVVYPVHRLEEAMLVTICSKPWELHEEIYSTDYDDLAVDMMKQLHPQSAGSLELFRAQIKLALPSFKLNTASALAYVEELVDRRAAEKFDLPDLGLAI